MPDSAKTSSSSTALSSTLEAESPRTACSSAASSTVASSKNSVPDTSPKTPVSVFWITVSEEESRSFLPPSVVLSYPSGSEMPSTPAADSTAARALSSASAACTRCGSKKSSSRKVMSFFIVRLRSFVRSFFAPLTAARPPFPPDRGRWAASRAECRFCPPARPWTRFRLRRSPCRRRRSPSRSAPCRAI